jgi:hypothetical protein
MWSGVRTERCGLGDHAVSIMRLLVDAVLRDPLRRCVGLDAPAGRPTTALEPLVL